MIDDVLGHLDYVVVILLALILYRMIGRPLAFKV